MGCYGDMFTSHGHDGLLHACHVYMCLASPYALDASHLSRLRMCVCVHVYVCVRTCGCVYCMLCQHFVWRLNMWNFQFGMPRSLVIQDSLAFPDSHCEVT